MRRATWTMVTLVGSILLAATGPRFASAQDTDERVVRARVLFERAEAHFAAGRFLPAAGDYRSAYDLMHEAGRATAPLILFNVGRAYDRAGDAERAVSAYERFVAEASAEDPEALARVGTVRERLRALRAQAPAPVSAGASTPAVSRVARVRIPSRSIVTCIPPPGSIRLVSDAHAFALDRHLGPLDLGPNALAGRELNSEARADTGPIAG